MSVKEYFNSAKTTMYQRVFTRQMLYNFLFALALSTYFPSICESTFASEFFRLEAEGHRLTNSLIYEKEVHSVMDCGHLCLSEHRQCKSINFEKGRKQHGGRYKCQLSNKTKLTTTAPDELVADSAFNYYEPVKFEYSTLENYETQGLSCSDLYKEGTRKDGFSCLDLYQKGTRTNGVYTIDPDGLGAFDVRCDMTTDGGGWTVFQKRMDGSVDFYLGWNDYKKGFGSPNGEFWLGLDKIHRLAKSGQNVLRVDLEDFENETRYAEYSTFAVANKTDNYILTLGGYSGNASDSLSYHNGMKFSTKDRENDPNPSENCATSYKGAWWYNACHKSNLNGLYLTGGQISTEGTSWYFWKSKYESLKKTEMKIRP